MNAWDIIDGQQRLTTLQLVLTAFKDVVKATGETKFDRDLERLTRNDGVKKVQEEGYKVWPTNADRSSFQVVMEAGGLGAVAQRFPGIRGRHKRETPRIAEAYAYFHRVLHRFVSGEADGEDTSRQVERIDALFETFRRHLHIVNIELEQDDDPQVIFESLNGRSIPLLPSDLIRNFVFLKADREGLGLDALYNDYWRLYDQDSQAGDDPDKAWWKVEERQGRLKRPRLDLFLFHYLQYRLGREVNIGHLFQEFRNWWDGSAALKTQASLAEMRRNAQSFATWVAPADTGRVSEFARWLNVLDTSTVYPLLFHILVEAADKMPPSERDGILDDLESYLIRRSVCGLTNKQYNRFFISLLRNLQVEPVLSRDAVRRHLMTGDGPSVRWPSDEEFGRAFLHRPAYSQMKGAVLNRLLLGLEHAMATRMHERIQVVDDLSVEHFMPQGWEKHWPLEDDSEENRERRERLLHSFGNLTLVTPEFNTSMSHREFAWKQKELKRITRMLLSRGFETVSAWDEDHILARGRDLFDVARRRWPHPESPTALAELSLEYKAEANWAVTQSDGDDVVDPPIDLDAAKQFFAKFAAARNSVEGA